MSDFDYRALTDILQEIEETNRLLTLLLKQQVPVHPDVNEMLYWSPES